MERKNCSTGKCDIGTNPSRHQHYILKCSNPNCLAEYPLLPELVKNEVCPTCKKGILYWIPINKSKPQDLIELQRKTLNQQNNTVESLRKLNLMDKRFLDEYCKHIFTTLLLINKPLRFNELHRTLNQVGVKISKPTLAEHLKHLIKQNIVKREEKGKQNISYTISKKPKTYLLILDFEGEKK